jgi:hypothetical protein
MGAQANAGQIRLAIDAAGCSHGLLEDVMHAAQGERVVEEVGEHFGHPAKRTVADQGQAEHELLKPVLGNGEGEQDGSLARRRWGEGLVQGIVGLVELPVDEGATDLVLLGQGADRVPGQGAQGELLALRRRQVVGRGHGRPGLGSDGRVR